MSELFEVYSSDDSSVAEDEGIESILQSSRLVVSDEPLAIRDVVDKLRKRLFFDFDDTLINTKLIKSRVLFRDAEKRGLSMEKILSLYKRVRNSLTMQLWAQELAKEIGHNDWAQIEAEVSDALMVLFGHKIGLGLVPEDSDALVAQLYQEGLPLRIITAGHPDFQIEKIHHFVTGLFARLLAVGPLKNPLRVYVDIVAPLGSEGIDKKFVYGNDEVFVDFVTHVGRSKSEVLMDKYRDVGKRVVYVNDKRSENLSISSSGEHVLPIEIDRNCDTDEVPYDSRIVKIETLAELFGVLQASLGMY
jgi:hypothetical protein